MSEEWQLYIYKITISYSMLPLNDTEYYIQYSPFSRPTRLQQSTDPIGYSLPIQEYTIHRNNTQKMVL